MGVKKLTYNYSNRTIFDLKDLNINDEAYQPLHLFHISNSQNINWKTRNYKYRKHIDKVMINLTYYPNFLSILNKSLLEKDGIYLEDYKKLKKQINELIDFEYKSIISSDYDSIVIAPILFSHNYPLIGIFILNNPLLLSKIIDNKNILNNCQKKNYTLISNFNKNEEVYSVIRNIYFMKKLGINTIKMHDRTLIDFKFMKIPLSVIIKNIAGYFPKMKPILIEDNFLSIKLNDINYNK
jgi:hypothetical protein